MPEATPEADKPGKRRPRPEDLEPLLTKVCEGSSLNAACISMGLDTPSTHTWLDDDDKRRQSYARAREQRAEHYQEQALELGMRAATRRKIKIDGEDHEIDPAGLRVALDAIKWATGRMAPKTAPITRIAHSFESLTDDELDEHIASLSAGEGDDDVEDPQP